MSDYKGVMIVAEAADGKLASIVAEVAAAAKKVADKLGEEVSAVLIGSSVAGLADEVAALGAKKVFVVDDAIFAKYQNETYAAALAQVVAQANPKVLLFGQTQMCRDLAPCVAFKLETGFVPDCVELGVEGGSVQMTRPVYGGNALATYTVEGGKIQIASVRSKTNDPVAKDASAKAEVVAVKASIDQGSLKVAVKEVVKTAAEGMRLEDAPVIVAGGRGVGSADNFKKLEALAKAVGGTIAGSRPAIDSGWIAADLQIGQTGKIVGPNLYVAVAISGAMQHMAGCLASKTIVAINKDAEAPIFKLAHFGIVGDWQVIVPAMTEKFKALG